MRGSHRLDTSMHGPCMHTCLRRCRTHAQVPRGTLIEGMPNLLRVLPRCVSFKDAQAHS